MDNNSVKRAVKEKRRFNNLKRLALYKAKRDIIARNRRKVNVLSEFNNNQIPNMVTNIPCYDSSVFIGKRK